MQTAVQPGATTGSWRSIRYEAWLHFFLQRSVNCWNNLSQEGVNSVRKSVKKSVNSFKNLLERWRLRKMDFFMD